MSQSKRGIEETSDNQSILNSYKKHASFLSGEKELDVAKIQQKISAAKQKDGTDKKMRHLQTFQDSTQKSNAKQNLNMAPIEEEIARGRKTVIFKTQNSKYNTSDNAADKENTGMASFSSRRGDGVTIAESTSKLPCNGIGDGIGDIKDLEQSVRVNEKVSGDTASPEVLEAGPQDGHASAFMAIEEISVKDIVKDAHCANYYETDVQSPKAVTGILKKKQWADKV